MNRPLAVEWISYMNNVQNGKLWEEKFVDFLNDYGRFYSMEEVKTFRVGRNVWALALIENYLDKRKKDELINMWIED